MQLCNLLPVCLLAYIKTFAVKTLIAFVEVFFICLAANKIKTEPIRGNSA